ncbi:MAG: DUF5615 family PIN-like protein [Cyanobium sp.]
MCSGKAQGDPRIGEFAAENDYTIVTKEDDFRALSLLHGAPPKTIWLVVGNISTAKILRILMAHITAIEAFIAEPITSLLTLRKS